MKVIEQLAVWSTRVRSTGVNQQMVGLEDVEGLLATPAISKQSEAMHVEQL
jgi:hypothetical protein